MKVLIIEDEQLAVERLKRMLKKANTDVEVVGAISTISGSAKWLSERSCDLIFLDIHLADGLSFDIFEQLSVEIPIIFTTAYDQYAIKAFQVNSVDYLLKPFSQEELQKSLDKYTSLYKKTTASSIDFKSLMGLIQQQEPYQKRFLIHSGQKIKSVPAEEAAYFYADSKMVFLHTFDDRSFVLDYTIDKLELCLNPEIFFRINRQFIINIKAIREMHAYPKSRVKIEVTPPCKFETIVSIERAARFKQWLNK